MADDEVELSGGNDDEYEVIPVGPIRRLEKRIDELEGETDVSRNEGIVKDMVDMMQTNQQMVNNMVQSTNELKNSVEDLTHKMDEVVDNMNEFMGLLEEASEASLEEDVSADLGENLVDPIADKMDELKETNQQMLEGLSSLGEGIENLDERMKRMYASQKTEAFEGSDRDQGGGRRGRGNRSGNRSGGRSSRSGRSQSSGS
ncbi:MAG: hypothetical protein ABEK12_00245, partial [Candidatus Nanohaloarchaea archaeon]